MEAQGALKGVKVLELAGLAPAPFCGLVLADFGADVIRIDRTSTFASIDLLCRGKRSIQLDLKNPIGKQCFIELCKKADVVIEGYRPGVLEELGLAPDFLLQQNSRLIVARLTGFGQEGPLKDKAGHDINYLATSGLLSKFGPADRPPVFPVNIVADFAGGGLMCAFGILLALQHRNTSGKGQVIDCAMIDGANYVSSFLYGGLLPNQRGNNLLDGGAFCYDNYQTKDGKYMSVGAIEPQFYSTLLTRMGFTEDEIDHFPHQLDTEKWSYMKEIFTKRFLTKTQEEWEKIFEDSDACVLPVVEGERIFTYPHNAQRNMFVEQEDGYKFPTPAPRLSASPARDVTKTRMPNVGEHTLQVFQEFGLTQKQISIAFSSGAAKNDPSSKL